MQIVEHGWKRDGFGCDHDASLGTWVDVRYDFDWVEMLMKGPEQGCDANFGK